MSRGNSYAMGQSSAQGPCVQYRNDGWDYRPVTHWDATEWRVPV